MVCPFSPEVEGGEAPFLNALRATGLACHRLTTCYRSDERLLRLLNPLREGDFGEVEHALMSAAGADLDCDLGWETEKTDQGNTKRYRCVLRAGLATVLFYTLRDVEIYTRRMQVGLEKTTVTCVDVKDAQFDPIVAVTCTGKALEDFLEGAPEELVFTPECPVRLGRSIMGTQFSSPGEGALTHSTGGGGGDGGGESRVSHL